MDISRFPVLTFTQSPLVVIVPNGQFFSVPLGMFNDLNVYLCTTINLITDFYSYIYFSDSVRALFEMCCFCLTWTYDRPKNRNSCAVQRVHPSRLYRPSKGVIMVQEVDFRTPTNRTKTALLRFNGIKNYIHSRFDKSQKLPDQGIAG